MKIALTGDVPRGTSLKGRYYTRQWRGQTIVCAWPKPRGQNLSPKQKASAEKFAEANLMVKYVDPAEWVHAHFQTHGTQFMARDLLVSQMYGQFWAVAIPGERIYYPVTARYDASWLLDFLAQNPGAMLYRGPEFWEAILPGEPGQVLVTGGPSAAPSWADIDAPSGVGGFRTIPDVTATTGEAGAFSTWASVLRPTLPVEITHIDAIITAVFATSGYYPSIARLVENESSYEIEEIVATGPTVPQRFLGTRGYSLALDAPTRLQTGRRYAFAVTITSGTATENLRPVINDTATVTFFPQGPFEWIEQGLRYNVRPIVAGLNPTSTLRALVYTLPRGNIVSEA